MTEPDEGKKRWSRVIRTRDVVRLPVQPSARANDNLQSLARAAVPLARSVLALGGASRDEDARRRPLAAGVTSGRRLPTRSEPAPRAADPMTGFAIEWIGQQAGLWTSCVDTAFRWSPLVCGVSLARIWGEIGLAGAEHCTTLIAGGNRILEASLAGLRGSAGRPQPGERPQPADGRPAAARSG